MDSAGSMNIVFHADLSHLRRAPARASCTGCCSPGADVGGIGMGLVRMVRPWNEWLIVWGYDINEPPPEVDDEMATRDRAQPRRRRHGRRSTIRSTSLWGNNKMYATRYRDGPRVLHGRRRATGTRRRTGSARTPRSRTPTTSPGSSRCVLRGQGGARRCSTPTTPSARRSAGRSCCARTRASRSSGRSSTRSACSTRTTRSDAGAHRSRARTTPRRPRGSARSCATAIELKNYEFNAHGVELGQRYRSGAVVADGTPEPAYDRDPELYYHPTTWPGARLPHVWLEPRGREGLAPTTSPARAGSRC